MIFGKKNSIGNAFYDVQCLEQEKQQKKSRSILRQLSQLSRRSIDSLSSTLSSPRTPSPRATFSDYPNPCELVLLSALQGHVISGDDMRNCATEIQALTVLEKQKLVNFFKPDSDASGIIENNAFKTFNCSNLTSDLLRNDEGAELLEQLWLTLNNLVVPSLQSMCFPLAELDASFDVQKLILTAFRDRVLAKLLQDVDQELPQLKTILLTILVETDEIPMTLKQKIDACLGKKPNPTAAKPRYVKKTRSKTDSCLSSKRKSVSWMDDMQDASRKSSTFCS